MVTTTTTKTKWITTITQVSMLKRVVNRWKSINIKRKPLFISSIHSTYKINGSSSTRNNNNIPSGFLAVYVGLRQEPIRFLIPTRFLKLPIFIALLEKSEEEYGLKFSGGIVLPCEVDLFKQLLKLLDKDEKKYGRLEVNELLKFIISDHHHVTFDHNSCKEFPVSSSNHAHFHTPLLKAISS